MTHASSHPAWVMNLVVQIDLHVIGLCGEFFRWSDERRHVVAAYLAAQPPSGGEFAEVGSFLRHSDHKSILTAAYGSATPGLRGALRRAGPQVHDQRFYRILQDLLAKPPHAGISRCIAQLTTIDETKLLILAALPEAIARASVVNAVSSPREAKEIAAAFELLTNLGVDRAGLVEALSRVNNSKALGRLWSRWAFKARCPAHPVPAAEGYRPVERAEDLHRLALRYRNCSRYYVAQLLEGRDAFAEVLHGKHAAVAHIRRSNGRWSLAGVYGQRNALPHKAVRASVNSHLEAHGVVTARIKGRKTSEWNALRKLVNNPYFDDDMDD